MSSGRPRGPERQRIILNVRAALAEEIKALAEHERRTVNSQVELLIERGLQAWPRLDVMSTEEAVVAA